MEKIELNEMEVILSLPLGNLLRGLHPAKLHSKWCHYFSQGKVLNKVKNLIYSFSVRVTSRTFFTSIMRLYFSFRTPLPSIPKCSCCFLQTMHGFLLVIALLYFSLTPAIVMGVPHVLNIQGRLTDEKNVNREGNFAMVFRIYNHPTAQDDSCGSNGPCLWKKSYLSVTVQNGNFQVSLGSPDGKGDDQTKNLANIFDGTDRWLGISVQGADNSIEPEMIPRQQLVTVPYSFNAANGVPIGTILDWFPLSPTTLVPDGFQICDGSPITDTASPFYDPISTRYTPNLISRFAYGVDRSRVGHTGGTIDEQHANFNLSHNHGYNDVPLHSHTLNDPGHNHVMFDGYLRNATGGGFGGTNPSTQGSGSTTNLAVTNVTLSAFGNTDTKTDSALEIISVMPRFFGVLKIIRIK